MKGAKRLLLCFLVLALILTSAVACTNKNNTVTTAPSDTAGAVDTSTTRSPDTSAITTVNTTADTGADTSPGHDLNGATISFVVADSDGNRLSHRSIIGDENTGNTVDRLIYERNAKIMEELNCKIVLYEEYTTDFPIITRYGDQLLAGDPDIDVISGRQWQDIHLARKGYMQDLTELREYLHWDRPYWDENYINGMNYNSDEHVYFLTGDLSLRYMGGFCTTFVNKEMYDSLGADKYGDIYDLVYNGDWMYDTVAALSSLVLPDQSAQASDIIGAYIPKLSATNGLMISAGMHFSRVNVNNTITFLINYNNPTFVQFAEKTAAFVESDGILVGNRSKEGFELFTSDKAMIMFGRLDDAGNYLRDMKNEYYVLPYPKLNKDQDQYYSAIYDSVSIYGINKYSDDVTAAAIVLDAMASESHMTIKNEYYDDILSYGYTKGDGSMKKMVDFISSVSFADPVFVWSYSQEYRSGMGVLGDYFNDRLDKDFANIPTAVRFRQLTWENATNTIIKEFEAIWASEQ